MKLISLNLRYDNPADSPHDFTHRLPRIVDALRGESADVLCFQEALPHMLQLLREQLPEYDFYGHGRGASYLDDEYNPIGVKRDSMQLLALDQFWLSDEPRTPASRFRLQSPCPRVCTWVKLLSDESGKPLFVYNTHLDHESHSARKKGLDLVFDVMARHRQEEAIPQFLVGDFNLPAHTKLAKELTGLQAPYVDLSQHIPHTFHAFGHIKRPTKIDYVLADHDTAANRAPQVTALRSAVKELPLSDHDGLVMTVALC